jgi:Flp pilus assembly protein TadB
MDGEESLAEQVTELREAVEDLESRIEDHTVHRSEIESDLKQYVRSRIRRGHARGWGPYLILLYGTAMTIGAFYLLSGGWAILAMVVVWLSTLGLYVLMVLAGLAVGGLSVPRRVVDTVRNRWR